jgi:hypothetical protein
LNKYIVFLGVLEDLTTGQRFGSLEAGENGMPHFDVFETFGRSPIAPFLRETDQRPFRLMMEQAIGVAAGIPAEEDRTALFEAVLGEFADSILAREVPLAA